MAGFFDRSLMGLIYWISLILVNVELVNGQW